MALDVDEVGGESVRDPSKQKAKWQAWKNEKVLRVYLPTGRFVIPDPDRTLILRYLEDMEHGINTGKGSKKGPRSYHRLNGLRQRMSRLSYLFHSHCKKSLSELGATDAAKVFNGMRNGQIRCPRGRRYLSTCDFVRVFKAFWHWHMRVQRIEHGAELVDVSQDLDSTPDRKPPFTYLTFEQLKLLCADANRKMRTIIWFAYDSGIRSPTELANVKGKDVIFSDRGVELNIRSETSKTFGRRIKLLLCGSILRAWIGQEGVGAEDYVFEFNPRSLNRYLGRLAKRVLGDGTSLGRKRFDQLTMYDLRHSSCCYWLPRYKSESALKYRFGWKESTMIHYYSEMLGMKDSITEDDLLDEDAKRENDKALIQERRERSLLEDELGSLRREMDQLRSQSAARVRADDLLDELLKDEELRALLTRKLHEKGLADQARAL